MPLISSSVHLPSDTNTGSDEPVPDLESQQTSPSWLNWPQFMNQTDDSDSDNPFNLSYFEKMSLFVITLIGSFACYGICIMFFPFLSLKPKKFALIWTLGSTLFLLAFAFLNGFTTFAKHLVSSDRVWFTASFLGSIVLTLLSSMIFRSTILTMISCAFQIVASIYYTVSYAPFGRQGLNLTTNMARNQVESWISS